MTHRMRIGAALLTTVFLLPVFALAQNENGNGGRGPACKGLPGYTKLKEALDAADRARTVGAHVTSILTKLDLSSRSAAAAYAVRHGLV